MFEIKDFKRDLFVGTFISGLVFRGFIRYFDPTTRYKTVLLCVVLKSTENNTLLNDGRTLENPILLRYFLRNI